MVMNLATCFGLILRFFFPPLHTTYALCLNGVDALRSFRFDRRTVLVALGSSRNL